MSRLAAFLSALWLTTTSAHPGFFAEVSNTATGAVKTGIVTTGIVTELQTVFDPLGKTIAFIGGKLCGTVKPIAGVAYKNYENKEPDMSELTLVFQNGNKTVIYNLAAAPTEFPLERWFDPDSPMLIFFHGFTDNPQKSSFQTMKQAVQALGNANILALDASSQIAFFYLRASTLVRFIGEVVGATLAALCSATGMDPSNIHLIGHSLGSHIAGFAGKQFYNITGRKVGRISGLDPAGPCFGELDVTLRLQSADAQFVDVIHSDAGVYGLNEKVGHVDFYPNSGAEQPNCLFQTCSHSRAWELYAESIFKALAFLAIQCNSYENFRHGDCNRNDTCVMGYYTPADTRGNYYLVTRGESPYGEGEQGATYKENGILRHISHGVEDTILSLG